MIWKIQVALEKAGAEFIPEDDLKGPGVGLKESTRSVPATAAAKLRSSFAHPVCSHRKKKAPAERAGLVSLGIRPRGPFGRTVADNLADNSGAHNERPAALANRLAASCRH